ncbi:MAG: hypothetical protein IT299_06850 [Dehalococcoidia bacterium]|nr:hypothetical protein [Dehalococcoidia bacterium]
MRTRRPDAAKFYLTEGGASVYDREQEHRFRRKAMIRAAMEIGATQADFEQTEEEQMTRWDVALPGDVFWELANDRALEAAREGRLQDLSMIQFRQALFLFEEGRDHTTMLAESNRTRLREYEVEGVVRVAILSNGCCEHCGSFGETVYPIHRALTEMPIPRQGCTYSPSRSGGTGWCICMWAPNV